MTQQARQHGEAYCPMIERGQRCCANVFTLEGWAQAANFCLGDFPSCSTYQRLLRELDRDPIPITITVSAIAARQFLDPARLRHRRRARKLADGTNACHDAAPRHLANQNATGSASSQSGAGARDFPGVVEA